MTGIAENDKNISMKDSTLRFLSAQDVRTALPMAEAVEVMREAFIHLSSGRAEVPLRIHIEASTHKGNALFMPSHIPGEGWMGIKVVTLYDENPARDLPRIQALVLLLDGTNGKPLAVMEGASLTAIRTGAASGLATELLARSDAERVAVLGAGVQGRTQLEAVCAVRHIRKAVVFDMQREAAQAFAREMTEKLGIEVKSAKTPTEALKGADIICTATTSSTPVFSHGDLKDGVHLNAVGSYKPHVQEIPPETVCRARVVVDHRESALSEAGDLIIPMQQGLFGEDHIHAELGEIAGGQKPGRSSETEVTLFKSVGVAVQDVAAAARVYDQAMRWNLGTAVTL